MMADVSLCTPVKSFEFDERITVDFKRKRKSQCDFSRIGCDSDFIAEGYHLSMEVTIYADKICVKTFTKKRPGF